MLTFLLAASLISSAPPQDAYNSDTLIAFVALANDRIIDGISYADGNGSFSGGIVYAGSAGLLATVEGGWFRGNGVVWPNGNVGVLETSLGWQWDVEKHMLSLVLLDYRVHHDTTLDHRGLSARYGYRELSLEIGMEADKPYFIGPYRGYVEYDVTRVAVAWTREWREPLEWYIAGGILDVRGMDQRQDFFAAGLRGRWRNLDWQFGVTQASDDLENLYGDAIGGTQMLLRVSHSFSMN